MVEISANNFTYRGVLLEVTKEEVYIKGATKTWTIPIDRVRQINTITLAKERPKEGAAFW